MIVLTYSLASIQVEWIEVANVYDSPRFRSSTSIKVEYTPTEGKYFI